MSAPHEIISDEEIIRVHGHANFGAMTPREVVDEGVRQYAIGYTGGHTQLCILMEHGLITKPKPGKYSANLTQKGKRYARAVSATRTDLSQASVAAALEAAAHEAAQFSLGAATAIRALITPDQRTALQAAIDAAKTEARAEDAAVLSKLIEVTETARDYVSDASMGYVWHQDQSGSPLVKLDTKMPKDDIKAIDAALAAARDVEAALSQIGANP